MTRSRRQHTPQGCRGCPACSWWPKREQREGKRTAKVVAREDVEAADLGTIRYDTWCAAMPADADEGDWDDALGLAGFS